MIDSPGWDDTHLDDAEVLATLAAWLNRARARDIQLTGILYLHSIQGNRVPETTARSFEWFEKLCGKNAFRKVQFVTTFWDEVQNDAAAKRRERELKQTVYWGNMIGRGARTSRHFNDLESARDIVDKLIKTRTDQDRGIWLDIQEQMAAGSRLSETTVGQNINIYNERQRNYFIDEMARIERDLRDHMKELDEKNRTELQEERTRHETELARVMQEKDRLHENIETLDERVQQLQLQREADSRRAEEQGHERARLRQEVQGLDQLQEENLQDDQRRKRLEADRRRAEQIVHNYTCETQ